MMGQSPKTKATETKDLDYWPEISDDKSDPDYEEELSKGEVDVSPELFRARPTRSDTNDKFKYKPPGQQA